MAENKNQSSTESPLTFKHLSYCGSKACTSMQEKSMFSDCSREVTACFTLISVTNCLQPVTPKGFEIDENHLASSCQPDLRLDMVMQLEVMDHLPFSTDLRTSVRLISYLVVICHKLPAQLN